jgi:hypothetical protein
MRLAAFVGLAVLSVAPRAVASDPYRAVVTDAR